MGETWTVSHPERGVTFGKTTLLRDAKQIEHTAWSPAVERRCEQCGRVGTRGFRVFPDADLVIDGRVAVAAHSMTECANRTACRKRRPRAQAVDE